MKEDMKTLDVNMSLHNLSDFLSRYYGKKTIILLDEYDTPMQEAYVHGFWEELVVLTRTLFNATFKTNPYMCRAIMTGITRVSRESMFSDLNKEGITVILVTHSIEIAGFAKRSIHIQDGLVVNGGYDRKGGTL